MQKYTGRVVMCGFGKYGFGKGSPYKKQHQIYPLCKLGSRRRSSRRSHHHAQDKIVNDIETTILYSPHMTTAKGAWGWSQMSGCC